MARIKQQAFSISEEHKEVIDILKKIPNKSKFVCQAVIEKYKRQINPETISPKGKTKTDNTINNKSNDDLKKLITEVLEEMLEKDTFLVKGKLENVSSLTLNSQIYNSLTTEECKKEKDVVVENETEEVSEDTLNQMKNIFNNW